MSIKISALPSIEQEGRSLNSVIPIVDSGNTTTNKIDLLALFGNNPDYVSVENLNQRNFIASCGTNINGVGTDEIGFRGSTSGSTILSSSGYIENSTNSILAGTIAGGSNTYINNGSQIVVMGSFRSTSNGGERSTIIACEDVNINNAYNAGIIAQSGGNINVGPAFMAGGQGGTINGSRTVHIGTEQGSTNSSLSGQYSSYNSNIDGNLYNVAIGTYQGTISSLGGSMENATLIGTRSCQIDHQGSSIISAENFATLHEKTLHTEGLHTYYQNSTEWRNGGDVSGNIGINLEAGNLWSFRITGDLLTINLTNARKGGEYEFFVENTGSYTINTMTLDGNAGTVFSSGGSLNPTNNGYSFYRLRIIDDGTGGLRGVMKEHLNFSAV